jgi:hypothetical protein
VNEEQPVEPYNFDPPSTRNTLARNKVNLSLKRERLWYIQLPEPFRVDSSHLSVDGRAQRKECPRRFLSKLGVKCIHLPG